MLLGVSAAVVAAGALAALGLIALGPGGSPVAAFFSLSFEENLPTWFSSILLFGCAALSGLAALDASAHGDPHRRHWWGLALGFAYMSLDEAVELHELSNRWFDLPGIFFFGWVIPAGIVVAIVGVAYLRFLAHLPADTRRAVVRAGALYVGGALGVELALGYWTDAHGTDNPGYALIDLVEESMEIFGAALFLCALVRHLARPDGVLHIVLGEPPPSRTVEARTRLPRAG